MQTTQADGTGRRVRPRKSCVRKPRKAFRKTLKGPSTQLETLVQTQSAKKESPEGKQRRIGQSFFNTFLGLQVAGEVFRQVIKDNNGREQDQANKSDLIDALFYERI